MKLPLDWSADVRFSKYKIRFWQQFLDYRKYCIRTRCVSKPLASFNSQTPLGSFALGTPLSCYFKNKLNETGQRVPKILLAQHFAERHIF